MSYLPSRPAYPPTTEPPPALLAAPSPPADKSIGESDKNVEVVVPEDQGPVFTNEGEAVAAAGRCSTPEQDVDAHNHIEKDISGVDSNLEDEDNGKGKGKGRPAKSSPQAASSLSDTIEHSAKGKEVDLLEAELEELLMMLGSLNLNVFGFLSVIITFP